MIATVKPVTILIIMQMNTFITVWRKSRTKSVWRDKRNPIQHTKSTDHCLFHYCRPISYKMLDQDETVFWYLTRDLDAIPELEALGSMA